MHAANHPLPNSDLGFTSSCGSDLILSAPIGTQMNPNCGMIRNAQNDIEFSGVPTVGFLFQDSDGDLEFLTH